MIAIKKQSETEYYLVKADMLPEVFNKVMAVKQLLNAGKVTSINEAVQKVGLSRSAYYKYKDAVLPFYENTQGRLVTLVFTVENFPGILSGIINSLANARANVLTINQNIPLNGLADVSVSVETEKMNCDIKALLADLERIPGVRTCRLLARD